MAASSLRCQSSSATPGVVNTQLTVLKTKVPEALLEQKYLAAKRGFLLSRVFLSVVSNVKGCVPHTLVV